MVMEESVNKIVGKEDIFQNIWRSFICSFRIIRNLSDDIKMKGSIDR